MVGAGSGDAHDAAHALQLLADVGQQRVQEADVDAALADQDDDQWAVVVVEHGAAAAARERCEVAAEEGGGGHLSYTHVRLMFLPNATT